MTVTPDPGHGLFIIGWVPVRVKHDQSVSPNEIEATAPSFAAQHEDKVRTLEREEGEKEPLTAQTKNLAQPSQLFSHVQTNCEDHQFAYLPANLPAHKVSSQYSHHQPISLTLPHPPEKKKSRET